MPPRELFPARSNIHLAFSDRTNPRRWPGNSPVTLRQTVATKSLEGAHRHGASLLTTVMLPAAAPELVNGLRLGLVNAWLFLVAAELIASSKGLGFLLIDSQNTGRTDVMLLAIVLLAVLGKLSDTALGAGENWTVRRRS
jgi:ABC-type nitrate/sulfonate/bicarbonate transport system permease component